MPAGWSKPGPLTLATFVGYAIVYTVILKPLTPQNIVIGGASGAMPPVLGWAAVIGGVSHEALLLFLIIFACIGRHILPNLLQSAMVIGTFAMASAIISEASLSFLGLGVPPEIPTWGSMLADGRTYISTSWWMALFPGLCIFFTVLGINLLGDGLRDIFDPRLKRTGAGVR